MYSVATRQYSDTGSLLINRHPVRTTAYAAKPDIQSLKTQSAGLAPVRE